MKTKDNDRHVAKRPGRRCLIGITFTILAIVSLANGAFGFGSRPNQGPSSPKHPAGEFLVIPVEGMSCMACVARVKRTLKSTPGVIEAQVSLEKHEAEIRYDPSMISPEVLAKVIDAMGYKAGTPRAKGKVQ
jgi:copper chaperone CopZ